MNRQVPADLRPRFGTPRAWYDWMVAESAAGRFPATRPATDAEVQAGVESPPCCYLSPDGRQCLVGGLFSPEDAGRLERAVGGEAVVDAGVFPASPRGWEGVLPDWLLVPEARAVQLIHDELAEREAWDHAEFVRRLNAQPVFAGVGTTPEGA